MRMLIFLLLIEIYFTVHGLCCSVLLSIAVRTRGAPLDFYLAISLAAMAVGLAGMIVHHVATLRRPALRRLRAPARLAPSRLVAPQLRLAALLRPEWLQLPALPLGRRPGPRRLVRADAIATGPTHAASSVDAVPDHWRTVTALVTSAIERTAELEAAQQRASMLIDAAEYALDSLLQDLEDLLLSDAGGRSLLARQDAVAASAPGLSAAA